MDGANKIRGNLPLLLIMDTIDYIQFFYYFQLEPADTLKEFKEVNFDFMAIDYAYMVSLIDIF